MSFTSAMAGSTLTMPISSPAALALFMPVARCIQESGRFSARCISSATGRLPSITMAMAATTSMASASGASPGISSKPVMYVTAPSINPRVARMRMNVAKTEKPRIIASVFLQMPSSNSSDTSSTGRLCHSAVPRPRPQTTPPRISATGMEISPNRMPRAKSGLESPSSMPMPMGMVKVTVQPRIAPTTMPEKRPTSGFAASSVAS